MNKKKKKVLIADDDPAILEVMELILNDEGYDVEKSLDGEVIYKMEKNYPDLLLLDIWMSGMDGRDICKYVKKNTSIRHIPVILVSANRDTERIAKESGADDFIAKPFDISELLEKVHKYTQ